MWILIWKGNIVGVCSKGNIVGVSREPNNFLCNIILHLTFLNIQELWWRNYDAVIEIENLLCYNEEFSKKLNWYFK